MCFRRINRSFEQLDTKSVLNEPDPKVAPCSHHIVIEVVVRRVQCPRHSAWLESAEGEETSRSLLQKVGEVLACRDRKVFGRKMLWSEPFLGEALDMLCLSRMVDYSRVPAIDRDLCLTAHSLSDIFGDLFDPRDHFLTYLVSVSS